MTLDRLFVECSALGFQSVLTTTLAITCYVLWRRQRRDYFLTWSAAWFLYVLRLGAMSAFLIRTPRPIRASLIRRQHKAVTSH